MHYPKYLLDRYIHQEMSWPARLLCAWHLRRCSRCQARLEHLRQNELLLNDLKELKKKVDSV